MHIRILAFVLVVVSVLLGCQDDGVPNTSLQGVATVDTENDIPGFDQQGGIPSLDSLIGFSSALVKPLSGATMNVAATSFIVPAGAVPVPRWISYSISRANPPPGMLDMPRRVFRFHPDGLVFLEPCELIVPFDVLDLGTIDPTTLTCGYYNPVTMTYEPQPTLVDLRGRRFVVQIHHFSAYGFGRRQ